MACTGTLASSAGLVPSPFDLHSAHSPLAPAEPPLLGLATRLLPPLVGGNVRVGLEDNIYLARGRLATNAELVERAVTILEAMNVRVLGPEEVREKLALRSRG